MFDYAALITKQNFSLQLEKHIDDVRKNRGNLSGDVGRELGRQNDATAQYLSRADLRSSLLYNTYQTGLTSYDQRARFQSGVYAAIETQRQLLKSVA